MSSAVCQAPTSPARPNFTESSPQRQLDDLLRAGSNEHPCAGPVGAAAEVQAVGLPLHRPFRGKLLGTVLTKDVPSVPDLEVRTCALVVISFPLVVVVSRGLHAAVRLGSTYLVCRSFSIRLAFG